MEKTPMTKKIRILLIDDNKFLYDTISDILIDDSQNGEDKSSQLEENLFGKSENEIPLNDKYKYIISTAYQGEEGYEMYKKGFEEGNPYDLVICDMRMPPGWNGLRTMKEIAIMNPDVLMILCTAFSDYSDKEIEKEVNCKVKVDKVTKPFKPLEFISLVEEKLKNL